MTTEHVAVQMHSAADRWIDKHYEKHERNEPWSFEELGPDDREFWLDHAAQLMAENGISETRYAELFADYRELRNAAIAVLSGSLRPESDGMSDALCALEREVYGEGQANETFRRERALRHLYDTASFLIHLHDVAHKAQLEWEQQPTPGELTYTDVIVRSVVAEMVRMGRGGAFPGHCIVEEYDLKALLSAAHSLGVSEWPVTLSLDVLRRVEKIVGHS